MSPENRCNDFLGRFSMLTLLVKIGGILMRNSFAMLSGNCEIHLREVKIAIYTYGKISDYFPRYYRKYPKYFPTPASTPVMLLSLTFIYIKKYVIIMLIS